MNSVITMGRMRLSPPDALWARLVKQRCGSMKVPGSSGSPQHREPPVRNEALRRM